MLLGASRPQVYGQGDLIYDIGDAPGGIFGIQSGIVGVRTDDHDLSVVYGHLMGRGAWFGENAVLTGAGRQVSMVALSPEVRVAAVSLKQLEDIAQAQPQFWRALAGLSAINAGVAIQIARDLMIRDAYARCRAVLSRLALSLGTDCPLPVSQEELAEMCGMSRGALSKVLGTLERSGALIRGYRSIVLLPAILG